MADVAHRAGVSVSTVSRTLRGLSTVSDTTRARVEAAARELSFAITRSASSLVTGRTGRVAVLMPDLASWFLSSALSGMAPALREAGLELLVYSVTDVHERADFFDRLPARRNADALLVVSFSLSPPNAPASTTWACPWSSSASTPRDAPASTWTTRTPPCAAPAI